MAKATCGAKKDTVELDEQPREASPMPTVTSKEKVTWADFETAKQAYAEVGRKIPLAEERLKKAKHELAQAEWEMNTLRDLERTRRHRVSMILAEVSANDKPSPIRAS